MSDSVSNKVQMQNSETMALYYPSLPSTYLRTPVLRGFTASKSPSNLQYDKCLANTHGRFASVLTPWAHFRIFCSFPHEQRVGCDLKIGSSKKVDACGVCGGIGESCSQPLYHWEIAPMSLCSVTCGGGKCSSLLLFFC